MDAVGICNLALAEIDPDLKIQALDEESTQGDACKLRFAEVRDELLGERDWRFATFRHELAAEATAPVYGPAKRYPLPPETIEVLEASDGADELEDWRREGRHVVTDYAGPVFIRSVDQVEDVGSWPPGFRKLVIYSLAARMCPVLSENRARTTELLELARDARAEAARADAKQGRGGRVFHGNLRARR